MTISEVVTVLYTGAWCTWYILLLPYLSILNGVYNSQQEYICMLECI